MASEDNPFAELNPPAEMLVEAFDPPRDQWGRPKIMTPEGKLKAYTRVSTMAKVLEDTYNLSLWQQRQVVKGLVKRKDLMSLASSLVLKPEDDKIKNQFKQICQDALDAAESGAAANYGTAVHAWTEAIDAGHASAKDAPAEMQPDLKAYEEALKRHGITVLESEVFVVCDELESAGTLDGLLQMPNGDVIVGDKKTGQWANTFGAASISCQVANYANGKRYSGTKERQPLHPDLDKTYGLLIHLPAYSGTCEVLRLDLELGWKGAEASKWVHGFWRKQRGIAVSLDK